MSCAYLVSQSESCFLQNFGEGFYTLQLGSFLLPNTKKMLLKDWSIHPHQKVLCNAGSERCRQKCNHTPIYHECENKYTCWQIHNPKSKCNMNTNLIKISFAVVWWNPSTFAITLQYTTSVNQIWVQIQIDNLQIQKYQCKIQK